MFIARGAQHRRQAFIRVPVVGERAVPAGKVNSASRRRSSTSSRNSLNLPPESVTSFPQSPTEMSDSNLIFYHSPQTRSSSVLILLEELDAPYTLRDLNFRTGAQRAPDYLAVNPLGKVPAIVHGGALVTELAAVFIYLADAFPERKLAPPIGDPLRGPYLRWLVFYGSAFEPALMDRHNKQTPPRSMSAYGDFEGVMALIDNQLAAGPYMLGARFTAADILWATALRWTTGFGLIPTTPRIAAYIERVTARPAFARVAETDAQLLKIHEAAAAKG
jgi:glutathione S-transferase